MNNWIIGLIIIGSIFVFSTLLVFGIAYSNGFFEDNILNCDGIIGQYQNGTFYCRGKTE